MKPHFFATSLLALVVGGFTLAASGQVFPMQSGGGQEAHTNSLSLIPPHGVLLIDYDFFALPDRLDVYYGGVDIFSSGLVQYSGQFVIPYGPGAQTELTIIMNQGGSDFQTTAWQYQPSIVPEPGFGSLAGLGLLVTAVWAFGKFLVGPL